MTHLLFLAAGATMILELIDILLHEGQQGLNHQSVMSC